MEIREVWKHRAASERHVWRAGKRAARQRILLWRRLGSWILITPRSGKWSWLADWCTFVCGRWMTDELMIPTGVSVWLFMNMYYVNRRLTVRAADWLKGRRWKVGVTKRTHVKTRLMNIKQVAHLPGDLGRLTSKNQHDLINIYEQSPRHSRIREFQPRLPNIYIFLNYYHNGLIC